MDRNLTSCRIKFDDDGTELDVIIKKSDYVGEDDEDIFFYGMSRDACVKAMEDKTLCEGEWYIIEVY